jgi:hypothetical protein
MFLSSSYQPPANSTFSRNKPGTGNQPAVLFSQKKTAPATSNQPNEHDVCFPCLLIFVLSQSLSSKRDDS